MSLSSRGCEEIDENFDKFKKAKEAKTGIHAFLNDISVSGKRKKTMWPSKGHHLNEIYFLQSRKKKDQCISLLPDPQNNWWLPKEKFPRLKQSKLL